MDSTTNNGMCRCCASEGTYKDVISKYSWMGDEEIYSDMLKQCFDIDLCVSSDGDNGGICEVCITQLRNAANFKKQVLNTEEQFKKHLQEKLYKSNIVKVEVHKSEDIESDNNASDDYSAPEFEVPIKEEINEVAKHKKRAAAAKATSSSAAKKPKTEIGETSTKRSGKKTTITIKKPTNVTMKLVKKSTTTSRNIELKLMKGTSKERPCNANLKITPQVKMNMKTNKESMLNKETAEGDVGTNPELPKKRKIELIITRNNCLRAKSRAFDELMKNQCNLVNVLLNSNASPIRYKDMLGYGCCLCPLQFPDPVDLKKHFLKEHNDDKLIRCIPKNMADHAAKIDITYLNCALCDKDIPSLEDMILHLKEVHKKPMYTDVKNQILPFKFDSPTLRCAICSTEYLTFKLLQEHMHNHYANYICNVCGAGFVIQRLLKTHDKRHITREVSCKQCAKTFNSEQSLKEHHMRMHLGVTKRNKCKVCNERFSDYWKKMDHMIKEHGYPPIVLKCQACDRTFDNQRSLSTHTKKDHLMVRDHKCTECEMKFFTSSCLRRHMTKHTGVRQYKCDVCFRAYARKSTLREHMRIHADDRRFACVHCGQAFVQKCSWKGHMRSKHGEIV